MRLVKRLSIILIFIFALASCATMNINLSPKQAAAWMNNIYSAQYDEYLTWFNVIGQDTNNKPIYALKPNVPEKQKQVLKIKKKIFIELEPLLKDYSSYAATGIKTPFIEKVIARAVLLVQQLVEMEGGN
jgi:hypothetical protein